MTFLLSPVMALLTRSEAMQELGLSPNFTEKELKSAYRKRSLETHPDKGGSNEEFVRVAEAYQLLNGGDTSQFSSQGGGVHDEEAMRQAEEMFFEMLEEFLNGQAVEMFIEKVVGDTTKLSWSQRQMVKVLKFVAKGFVKMAADALMNDAVKVNVNGQIMSGGDLKRWREKMSQRKKGVHTKKSKRKTKSDL